MPSGSKPNQQSSKPVLTAYRIDAFMQFDLANTEYAISSFAVSYSTNGIPTAQIRPAFGLDVFQATRAMEDVMGGSIGKYISIYFKLNGVKYGIFYGTITSYTLAQGFSGTTSSMAITYNAVGALITLTALPPISRIVMAPKDVNGILDSYSGLLMTGRYPIKGLDDIAKVVNLKLTDDAARGVVNILKYFYEMEGSESKTGSGGSGGKNLRVKQETAVNYINEYILPNIADMHFAPALTQGYDYEVINIMQTIATQWPTNSGFQILSSNIARLYGMITSSAMKTYIIPDTSFMKTPVATITASQIFGSVRSKAVEPVPLAGVAMSLPMVNYDKTNSANHVNKYRVFPEATSAVTPGMYAWATPPPWFDLYRRLKQQEEAAAETTKKKSNPEGTKKVSNTAQDDTKDKNGKSFVDKETEWLDVFVKAEWGNRIWSKEQITLSTDYIASIAPGNLIRVYPTNSKDINDSFVGMVRAVALECSVGSFKQTFVLGNVRTHSDNERMALPNPHPLFTEYKQELIPLFDQSNL
jgi:hypothetical protein